MLDGLMTILCVFLVLLYILIAVIPGWVIVAIIIAVAFIAWYAEQDR